MIGTITESNHIIAQAAEKEGGFINMCGALERLEKRGLQQGLEQGIVQGLNQRTEEIAIEMLKKKHGQRLDQRNYRYR